jgi:hypothetical protein
MSDSEQAGPSLGDVLADVVFEAIDKVIVDHLAVHPEDAAKFAEPDYTSPVVSIVNPTPPAYTLPGGPCYPRELTYPAPFPLSAQDNACWGYNPFALPPEITMSLEDDPKMEELKPYTPPNWNGYVEDANIGWMVEEHFLGKRLTLDMLYAPHPDPFQRIGKKGPPTPWPSGGHLWSHRHLTAFWGNWHIHEPNNDFYNIWQRNENRSFPPPLTLYDLRTSFADAITPLNTLLTQKVKEMTKSLSAIVLERMSVRTFVAHGMGNRNPCPSGSMRKKKAKRHTALRRVYGDSYKRMEFIDIKEGKRGEVPDIGEWQIVQHTPPDLPVLFDHGNGVKTYLLASLSPPSACWPEYPKMEEPPFPPPFKVIPKGEGE